jgi:arabinogalactan oligomer/maltooligosaccharide transport system permease protein
MATQWGLYAAGALIVSIPVLILFISISRYLVSGLTMGSVKG